MANFQRLGEAARDAGLLVLRVTAGGLCATRYGLPKLEHFAELANTFADPFGIGSDMTLLGVMLVQLVGAALVVVGLGARFASLLLAVVFAGDIFVLHPERAPWDQEASLLYAVIFLALALTGSGRAAAAAFLRRGR